MAWSFWGIVYLSERLGWISFPRFDFHSRAYLIAALILYLLFFHLITVSISKTDINKGWSFIGGFWLAIFIFFEANVPGFPALLYKVPGWQITQAMLKFVILVGGWWPYFIGSMILTFRACSASSILPFGQRRAYAWWAALILTNVGILYVFSTAISGADPILGFSIALPGALISLYAARPRPVSLKASAPSHTLREFGLRIHKIFDPEKLTRDAAGLIKECMEIRSGYLYLVNIENSPEGTKCYRLVGINSQDTDLLPPGLLSDTSPLVKFFRNEQRSLSKHELRLLCRTNEIPVNEIEWLNVLDTHVFVPIFVKGEWEGLVALGPKITGEPYSEEEYDLLSIFADQTGIALQNARLVESLTRVNQDFRRAYLALEKANNHLERLDRVKSDFISICSHELRTPISVIRGYSEMLNAEPEVKQHAYHNKLVSGIQNGTVRLHEIVESMLDIASIDTRSLELQKEMVSLHVVLRLAGESFKKSLLERQIDLQFEDLRSLPEIEADSEALLKVFSHLIANALKFTPNGGCITISGKPEPESHAVKIIVQDTGIGIAQEARELIFTKFYQTGKLDLHSSGKTKFKGAGPGLGLAIAKGILEAHGGKIWVESPGYDEENCPGSEFHVFLPVRHQFEQWD